MNLPKILLAVPTHEGHKYALEKLIDSLSALSYINIEILFVDTTKGDQYANFLQKVNLNVKTSLQHIEPTNDQTSTIVTARNAIRNFFLKGKFEYLFFVDSDMIVPSNAIEKLFECTSDIASGAYLCKQNINGNIIVAPSLYVDETTGKFRVLTQQEVQDSKIINVAICGLGCTLIKREVLEKVSFRKFSGSKTGGEHIAFCLDARKQGFAIKANTAVKCEHLSKNEILSFVPNYSYSPYEKK